MKTKPKTEEIVVGMYVQLTVEECYALAEMTARKAFNLLSSKSPAACNLIKKITDDFMATQPDTSEFKPAESTTEIEDGKKVNNAETTDKHMHKVYVKTETVNGFNCIVDELVKAQLVRNDDAARGEALRDLMGQCYDNSGNLDTEKWIWVHCCKDKKACFELAYAINKLPCANAKVERVS